MVIVQDMLGAPVAGAEVRLLHPNGNGDNSPPIITDQDGRHTYSGEAYAAYASAIELFGISMMRCRRATSSISMSRPSPPQR